MNSSWQVGDVIETDIEAWEVRKVLQGGMGFVYIVYERSRKELRAAKTFQNISTNAAALFLRECKAWLNVGRHENIVEAVFVRQIHDQPFLFLEYVGGGDLAAWIGTPGLLEDRAQLLLFAIQFCDALEHAVRHGVTAHRDIKPANCLVTSSRTLKVTDFGLASVRAAMNREEEEPAPARRFFWRRANPTDTRTGAGGGTPPFMPPEQFANMKYVDIRADVYSFGVMLFQMATGRLPFVADEYLGYYRQHRTVAPPRLAHEPALDAIVQTCLAKKPEERYGSFAEIRVELASLYREVTGREPPAPKAGDALVKDDWFGRMVNFSDLGMIEEAKECLERLRELDPEWVGGQGYLIPRITDRGLEFVYSQEAEHINLAKANEILRDTPDDRDALTMKGVSLLYLDRPEEAIAALDHALAVDGRWAPAWMNKALALQKLGRPHEARTCVEKTLEYVFQTEQWPDNQKELHRRALALEEELRAELERLAVQRIGAAAQAAIGEVADLRDDERHEEAIALCERVLRSNADVAMLWFLKGDSELKIDRFDQAVVSLTRAAALEPYPPVIAPQIWQCKGDALAFLERYDEAMEAYDAAIERGAASAYVWNVRGDILLKRLDRPDEAIESYRCAAQADGGNADGWKKLGAILVGQGRAAEARTAYEEASRLGDETSARFLQGDLEAIAQVYMQRRQLTAAIAANPGQATLYVERGMVAMRLQLWDDATRDFTAAIDLDPSQVQAYYNRAGLRQTRRDYSGAIDDYSAALALDPRNPAIYGDRGGARMESGDLDGAIEDCTRAIALNRSDFVGYLNRALSYMRKGDRKAALADARRALVLDPANELVQQIIRDAQRR